jgi:hypothetical protein
VDCPHANRDVKDVLQLRRIPSVRIRDASVVGFIPKWLGIVLANDGAGWCMMDAGPYLRLAPRLGLDASGGLRYCSLPP